MAALVAATPGRGPRHAPPRWARACVHAFCLAVISRPRQPGCRCSPLVPRLNFGPRPAPPCPHLGRGTDTVAVGVASLSSCPAKHIAFIPRTLLQPLQPLQPPSMPSVQQSPISSRGSSNFTERGYELRGFVKEIGLCRVLVSRALPSVPSRLGRGGVESGWLAGWCGPVPRPSQGQRRAARSRRSSSLSWQCFPPCGRNGSSRH